MTFNNEEDIRKLVKSGCKPVTPSPEFKERLLGRLTFEASGIALSASLPLWKRPKLWAPIAGAVISGVIVYGVWLSLQTAPLSP